MLATITVRARHHHQADEATIRPNLASNPNFGTSHSSITGCHRSHLGLRGHCHPSVGWPPCRRLYMDAPSGDAAVLFPQSPARSARPTISQLFGLRPGQRLPYRVRWHVLVKSFRAWVRVSTRERASRALVRPGSTMPRRGPAICPPSPPPWNHANDPRAPPQPDWTPQVILPPVISMYGLDIVPVNDGSFDWRIFSLISFEDWSQLRACAWFW